MCAFMWASISERSALYTSSMTNITAVWHRSFVLGGQADGQSIEDPGGVAADDLAVRDDDSVQAGNASPALQLAAQSLFVLDFAELDHRRNARLMAGETHQTK